MRTRLRRLAEQVSVPEPVAERFKELQQLADLCGSATHQERVDALVMQVYSLGWHQGYKDAPYE